MGPPSTYDYSKNVVRLGLVSLFNDVSTEMILGVLPLYMTRELGASMAALGLIEGLGEAAGQITRSTSGALSDRLGRRKPLVLLGYALSTLAKPLFALSTAWSHGLVLRVADRLGKGVRTPPRDALLSESVVGRVGRAFGIHRALDQAGAIVGPLLAFLLMPLLGMRGIFLLSLLPGTAALLLLLLVVRERPGAPRMSSLLSGFRDVLRGRFLQLVAVLGIFSLGAFNFSFILLRGVDVGVDTQMIPLLFMVINVAHTLVAYPAGLLSDRLGGERTLLAGYTVFLWVSLAGLVMPGSPWVALLMALLFGLHQGITETVQRAIIPGYVPGGLLGTAYSAYYLIIGLSLFTANAAFGSLWELHGPRAAFTYSLTTSLLGVAGLTLLLVHRRPASPPEGQEGGATSWGRGSAGTGHPPAARSLSPGAHPPPPV